MLKTFDYRNSVRDARGASAASAPRGSRKKRWRDARSAPDYRSPVAPTTVAGPERSEGGHREGDRGPPRGRGKGSGAPPEYAAPSASGPQGRNPAALRVMKVFLGKGGPKKTTLCASPLSLGNWGPNAVVIIYPRRLPRVAKMMTDAVRAIASRDL